MKLNIDKEYSRHPFSLFRVLRRLDFYRKPSQMKKTYVPQPYDTPTNSESNGNLMLNLSRSPAICHNDKVERSHRNDNERFYQFLDFFSLDDLRVQAARYLKRSNNIPMYTLHLRTLIQQLQLLQ